MPTSENQREFDELVMALSKVLVERLNEAEISKYIEVGPNEKGITKFDRYLEAIGYPKRAEFVLLLRNLNGLRSGPAHVKGKDYQRAANHFDLEGRGVITVFSSVLTEAAAFLEELGHHSAADKGGSENT